MDKLSAGKTCEVLHFAATPFVERRLPLAAIVTLRGAVPELVCTQQAPDWRCAGGWQAAALAEYALAALKMWNPALEGVPKGFEDILYREPAQPVPMGWRADEIREYLWGAAPQEHEPRGQIARTLGRAFFEARHVGKYVRENLDPNSDLGGRYRAAAAGGRVPQYVHGAKQLVVLEPIIADGSAVKVAESIKRLAVWQRAVQKHREEWPQVTLVAYALERDDGHPAIKRGQFDAVREFADAAYDTRDEVEASSLVQRVREAALAA